MNNNNNIFPTISINATNEKFSQYFIMATVISLYNSFYN